MEIYSYIEKRRSLKRRKRLLIFTVLLLILVTFFSAIFYSIKINIGFKQEEKSLNRNIQASLNEAKGVYAISIKNLKTNETYFVNEHKVYDSGSLYKLWIMATVYQQIEAGILNEDEMLSGDIATLNEKFNISSDSADLTEGVITLGIRDALNQMITISHNYAALLLTERVKLSSVAQFLDKNGFKESSIGSDNNPPQTTSSDIALFFEKLYKGELASQENTIKMLEFLKKQQLNDKLPKLLPEGTVVAHKTGEIDYQTHDAGIVYSPKGDYIIVIMSESDMPSAAADREAQISKAVYDYFNI